MKSIKSDCFHDYSGQFLSCITRVVGERKLDQFTWTMCKWRMLWSYCSGILYIIKYYYKLLINLEIHWYKLHNCWSVLNDRSALATIGRPVHSDTTLVYLYTCRLGHTLIGNSVNFGRWSYEIMSDCAGICYNTLGHLVDIMVNLDGGDIMKSWMSSVSSADHQLLWKFVLLGISDTADKLFILNVMTVVKLSQRTVSEYFENFREWDLSEQR